VRHRAGRAFLWTCSSGAPPETEATNQQCAYSQLPISLWFLRHCLATSLRDWSSFERSLPVRWTRFNVLQSRQLVNIMCFTGAPSDQCCGSSRNFYYPTSQYKYISTYHQISHSKSTPRKCRQAAPELKMQQRLRLVVQCSPESR
jgi:hypothetical protein